MTSDAWIRTKSIELDIPFSHILSAYILELTAQLFATDKEATLQVRSSWESSSPL